MQPSLAFVNSEAKLLVIAEMAGFKVGTEVTAPDGLVYVVEEIQFVKSDYNRAIMRLKAVGQPRLPFRVVEIRLPIVSWEPQTFPAIDWSAGPDLANATAIPPVD